VHDSERPQPAIVAPGTLNSQDEPGKPPSDAAVLFDGKDLSHWCDNAGNPASWKLENGAMVATKSDIVTKQVLGDIQLHVQFCEPSPGKKSSQDRRNSGVFLMGLYEVQVVDCWPEGESLNKRCPLACRRIWHGAARWDINYGSKARCWKTLRVTRIAPATAGL
jgi:hypothetical protein